MTDLDDLLTSSHGTWRLDPTATTVELHTRAMFGAVKVKASFRATAGEGVVGPGGAVSGSLTIDAASVDTGTAKRDKHLRSKDFFEVETYPTFVYTATAAGPDAGGVLVTGTLTVHGQTHPLDVRAAVRPAGPDSVTVVAEADVDRGVWGIDWAKMGARLDNHVIVTATFTRA